MSDVTVTIEADGESEQVTIPEALIDRLSDAEESAAMVVGDVASMGFAGRAHALVHHAEGEPDEDLTAAEERMMDLFEERFGVTYGEATGHSH